MRNVVRSEAAWRLVAMALAVLVAGPFLLVTPGCGGKNEIGYYEEKNVAVPMRDGVVLRADVRRPAADGKYPVLIFRTPYDKEEGDPDNELTFRHAVERGYAMVIQDVRGRYASDGEYTPYINEGKDGYDTIEWAAAQPWSNGQVGTFGLSYPGAVQWLAAVENPPQGHGPCHVLLDHAPVHLFRRRIRNGLGQLGI
jgi:predicted acyl esterase